MQLLTVDIRESELAKDSRSLLQILLKDRTTKRNIVWASPSYEGLGKPFCADQPIKMNLIVGPYDSIIQPRVEKNKRNQDIRTRKRAEVFTPPWLVDKQVKIVESEIGNLDFERYIRLRWLELACGEAPYMVTRYDSISGTVIPIPERVGFVDRKLQRVCESTDSEKNFIKWAKKAYQSSYGYELQGDSLLLARENLLLSFYEYYQYKFDKEPELKVAKDIAKIISYNVVQMNGITKRTPYSAQTDEGVQLNLFDAVSIEESDDIETSIKHWDNNTIIRVNDMHKGDTAMKFDVVIGNPPYQEATEGTSDKPIYNYMMDAAEDISDRVCLITPARFLFNAGKTPKDWNRKKLADTHFKVMYYEQDSSKVFSNTDIKGGIAITYRDANKNFGEIGTFTAFEELNSILKRVRAYKDFKDITSLIYLQNKFNLQSLYEEHPEYKKIIGSQGKEKRLTTAIFTQLESFTEERVEKSDIKILGLINNKRVYKYIHNQYLEEHENLECYKVILPKANGSGAIGEVLSTPLVGEPLVGYTQSFISFGKFKLEVDAINCMKYIKTKFSRALLGTLKITQDNNRETWRNVPLQDFTVDSDIDWSQSVSDIDRQLYAKYKLSQEEIDFIEEKVRAMD